MRRPADLNLERTLEAYENDIWFQALSPRFSLVERSEFQKNQEAPRDST
jgi:hypothetical protein